MRTVVVMLALAGCGKAPPATGATDLASGVVSRDLAVAHDLATAATGDMVHPRAGISCGSEQCAASAQYCCTGDSGKSGTCDAVNMFNCAHTYFFCDGPEDCPPALGECCFANGSATCVTPGQCAQMAGKLMCHVDGDCQGLRCCEAPASPYELCLSPACT